MGRSEESHCEVVHEVTGTKKPTVLPPGLAVAPITPEGLAQAHRCPRAGEEGRPSSFPAAMASRRLCLVQAALEWAPPPHVGVTFAISSVVIFSNSHLNKVNSFIQISTFTHMKLGNVFL